MNNILQSTSPEVSVLVPVFNGEKYLERALRSIQNQSFGNFECLVVDDGSINSTYVVNVVNHLKDPRFKVLTKTNGGVATALNLGISNAKGKFFCWLSHDDMWEPSKLEQQVSVISSREIICSNYKLIDEDDNLIAVTSFEKIFDVSTGINLISRGLIHGCSVMAPMSIFEDIGTFDTNLKYTQDYDLWLRAIESGYKFKFQSLPTTIGRIHPNQTGKKSDTRVEGNQIWERIVDLWFEMEVIEKGLVDKLALMELEKFTNWARANSLMYVCEHLDTKVKHLLNKIKVSVVIPYRDRKSSLQDAVLSVLAQSHNNIEIIIVDDSHDPFNPAKDLLKKINLVTTASVVVLENPGIGVSSARNLGLKHSSGEYVAFLDSDDFFVSTKLQTQLSEMVKNEALFGHTNYLRLEDYEGVICDTSLNSGNKILESMVDNCKIATPTVMLRNQRGLENLFNSDLNIGEDSDAWIRYIGKYGNRISHLITPLTVVRTGPSSARSNQEEIRTIIKRNTSTVGSIFSRRRNTVMRFRQNFVRILFYFWRFLGRPRLLRENKSLKKLFWRIRGF